MSKQNPYNAAVREQHPIVIVKTWPNAVTPTSSTPLPGTTTKTTPTK
jgi:hypothetical protein